MTEVAPQIWVKIPILCLDKERPWMVGADRGDDGYAERIVIWPNLKDATRDVMAKLDLKIVGSRAVVDQQGEVLEFQIALPSRSAADLFTDKIVGAVEVAEAAAKAAALEGIKEFRGTTTGDFSRANRRVRGDYSQDIEDLDAITERLRKANDEADHAALSARTANEAVRDAMELIAALKGELDD